MPAIAIPIAMAAASAASSYAASRAQGRKEQAAANQQQDQLRLAAQQQGMSNPRTTMQDMVRAQLLGMAPTAGPVGTGQGGLPPTPGGVVRLPQTQAPEMDLLQQVMQRNALMQGMKGYAPSITPTPLPQPTKLDKVLGVVGALGTGATNAYLGGRNIAALYPNAFGGGGGGGAIPGGYGANAPSLSPPMMSPVSQPNALYGSQFGGVLPQMQWQPPIPSRRIG